MSNVHERLTIAISIGLQPLAKLQLHLPPFGSLVKTSGNALRESPFARRNERFPERLSRPEVTAMHMKDTETPGELRNPDLSRMYKEVVKLRLEVRQAEAEARSRNAGNSVRRVI